MKSNQTSSKNNILPIGMSVIQIVRDVSIILLLSLVLELMIF